MIKTYHIWITIINLHFLVIESGLIEIYEDGEVTYLEHINVTCTEKSLMDTFSGWELDLDKPIDEIEVIFS